MRIAATILVLSLASSALGFTGSNSFYLPHAEQVVLARKATDGDAEAAWTLHLHFSLAAPDQKEDERWLRRAAELGHASSLYTLAVMIKDHDWSAIGLGPTREAVVLDLFRKAAERKATYAAWCLGDCYESGYGGEVELAQARRWYLNGAQEGSSLCRKKTAEFFSQGKGGPTDIVEAYFWISVEFNCVHPGSVGGKEVAAIRERIAAAMPAGSHREVWRRIDEVVRKLWSGEQPAHDPPFLRGMVTEDVSAEAQRLAQIAEKAHRDVIESVAEGSSIRH